MTVNGSAEVLDCRGQRCPAPILALSKRARTMADSGGLLEIRADDPAFSLDLRSWCRSTKAEVIRIDDEGNEQRALIRVPGKAQPARRPDENIALADVTPVVPASETTELDCRGTRCPEPILAISRAARAARPGTEITISADDDAFPLDLRSWCRSAGATLIELGPATDGGHRARIRTRSSDSETSDAAPRAPSSDAGSAERAQGVSFEWAAGSPVVDLRALPTEIWETVLDGGAKKLGVGGMLRLVADDPNTAAHLVSWCAARGHEFVRLDTGNTTRAEIRVASGPSASVVTTTALAKREDKATGSPDCTLLVLHNDHEALLAALLVAVGAASQGKQVVVFFTFWGLNLLRGDHPNKQMPKEPVSWMQRMMKMMMPKGPARQSLGQMNFGGAGKLMLGSIMKKRKIMSLPELMNTAEEQGVRFIACTMSMEVMGITKRDLAPRTNLEYGGVAAFVNNAHGAGMSLVF